MRKQSAGSAISTHHRQAIRKRTEPAFIEPMQCKPVSALPVGGDLTFEIKFDGYRCLVVKRGSEVTLFSRNEKLLNKRFPKIVTALGGDFVLDGELVAFDPHGKPSFQLLQNNLSRALPVYFYAFDLLNRNGEYWSTCPLNAAANCWGACLPRPKTRCACRRSCWPLQDKFLRPCAWADQWKRQRRSAGFRAPEMGHISGL